MVTYDIEKILGIILLSLIGLLILVSIIIFYTRQPPCLTTEKTDTEGSRFISVINYFLISLPQFVDKCIRSVDFRFSRSYDHKLFKWLFREGHPKSAYFLIFLALFFIFSGLNPEFKINMLFAFVMAVLLTATISWLAALCEKKIKADTSNVFMRYIRFHALHSVSTLIILVLSVGIWCYLEISENPVLFYKHIHIPIITVLLSLSLVAIMVRSLVFKKPRDFCEFSKYLNKTQLVKEPERPEASWATAVYGLLTGPTYHVLKLLLLPSWIIVLIPAKWMEWNVVLSVLALSWLLLAVCTIHKRLHFFLSFLDRWFLTGGQLIVSLIIIVLAIARIFEISYVSTLLDGAPIMHVAFFVTAAYSSLLLYEYWNNSVLCHYLMTCLRDTHEPDCLNLSRIPYQFTSGDGEPQTCFIELYSGARFALVDSDDRRERRDVEQLRAIYEKREIFETISKQHKGLRNIYSDLSKRVLLYFTLQNILLIGTTVMTVFWVLAQEPKPMVSANLITAETVNGIVGNTNRKPVKAIDLKDLVLNDPARRDHVIFLSASGGGTRAALYTTALLAALREREQLDNVVLASGVSGGGMSLAYFASNRNYLLKDSPMDCSATDRVKKPNAWCDYIDVVADNHIRYVASRIGNAAIYSDTSLGQYLADRFEKSFAIHHEHKAGIVEQESYYAELDHLEGLGLILNTSLVAHPYDRSGLLKDALGFYEKKKNEEKQRYYILDAGGRLIFTNIRNLDEFPGIKSDDLIQNAKDVEFKYLIGSGPGIHLSTIGALTANFPPVFPNAIVELSDKHYRVTDGGAVENRGLISLLYAVRSMLENLNSEELKRLPVMHIVMAEASGESIDYKSYMTGLTAKNGSSVMIANQLILELKEILERKCEDACEEKLKFHYLNMPLMMRARGGLGTHWKMPGNVKFNLPTVEEDEPDREIELSGAETICLLQELFSDNIENRSSPVISVDLSMDAQHQKCHKVLETAKNNRDLLYAAFLKQETDLQHAWKLMQDELEKK